MSDPDTISSPSHALRLEPDDEFNRSLLSHVHPADWKNPNPKGRYDLVVVGAGAAGLITSIAAAGLGKKVALVEKHLMGGDCLNVGCVPSKALIRAAHAAAEIRRAGEFGMESGNFQVDFGQVMRRMRELRARIAPHDSARRYTDQGVDVFLGHGRFTGSDSLEVNGVRLNFSKACIATGARAAAPPISGLQEIGYLTNETVFSLTELPRRLAVIGAGPIGCELAQSFQRFGSEVYLFEATHGVLPREDPDAAEIVRNALLREGVKLYCCGKNLEISRTDGGKRLSVSSHDQFYTVDVDEILVAVGRAANVENLGLEAAGVTYERSGVQVDDFLRTTNPRIFAAGDICMKYKFTHAADAAARIVVRNALLGFLPFWARASKLVMPWCTYTDPEIAHVGETAASLKAAGRKFETISIDMAGLDRAILEGETAGLLKVLTNSRGCILGATLVGTHAGESIGQLTTAMVHGLPLHALSKVIAPYPTQAEIIKRAADQAFKSRLLAIKKRFLGK